MVDNTNINTNTYDYSNETLAPGGMTEHLVRSGYVNDPDGVHQPRTPANSGVTTIPSSLTIVDLPESQMIKEFDKRKVIVWERRTDTGREFVTYDGRWYYEFLKGYSTEAAKFADERIAAGKNTHRKYERKGRYLFELSVQESNDKLVSEGLEIGNLRNQYDAAVEITPFFKDMERNIPGESTVYFMKQTLKEFEDDLRVTTDLKYFNDKDPMNYVDYYFGGRLSGPDIGFYVDNGGRIRANYDPHLIYRSEPLINDLLELGSPDEYMVAHIPTGMIQFVINYDLVMKLLKKYGGYDALAERWNNEKITYTNDFRFGNYPTFEDTLDVKTKTLVSSHSIFRFTTTDDEKK